MNTVCHGCTWWYCTTFGKCGMIRNKVPKQKDHIETISNTDKKKSLLSPNKIKKSFRRNVSIRSLKRLSVYRRNNYKCVVCDSETNLTVDHVIPVSKGGSDKEENLQTMCNRCNVLKGNKVITNEELKVILNL